MSPAKSLGPRRDEDRWIDVQDAMIDGMTRLERALRPFIDRLSI
jgi:hypothetical protein